MSVYRAYEQYLCEVDMWHSAAVRGIQRCLMWWLLVCLEGWHTLLMEARDPSSRAARQDWLCIKTSISVLVPLKSFAENGERCRKNAKVLKMSLNVSHPSIPVYRWYVLFEKPSLIDCVDSDIICQNVYTASNLKHLFHNIYPKWIISFIQAIGLTNI